MAAILTKEHVQIAIDFLKKRSYMPHNVASWCLEKKGVIMGSNGVMNLRRRRNLPYARDAKIHNSIQAAVQKGIEVTDEYLREKCPHICQEYRDYLIEVYVKKDRVEIEPVPVRTMAFYVQQLTANEFRSVLNG